MEQTLVLIKPDAFSKRYTWDIIKEYNDAGFDIVNIKILIPSIELCMEHYIEHKDKPFFKELVDFLSSGSVCALVLQGENAVSKVRELNGNTNPENAKEGTIRRKYGESMRKNAVHASDSIENAKREINLWFK